jgi:hypothetical protein
MNLDATDRTVCQAHSSHPLAFPPPASSVQAPQTRQLPDRGTYGERFDLGYVPNHLEIHDTNIILLRSYFDTAQRTDFGGGDAMPEPTSPLMLEFLSWVASRRRTYDEAMDAWRSTCPRHTIWEDALSDGLIQVARRGTTQRSDVTLTPRGQAVLDGSADHSSVETDPRLDA